MPRTSTRQPSSGSPGDTPPDTPRPDVPDQVMMPLLDRIVRQSLDEDYRVVAARKKRSRRGRPPRRPRSRYRPPAPPPRPGRPRQVAAVVMSVFGVLVALAAVQTSRNAPEANASRDSLIDQVQARRANVANLQERLDRLRASTVIRTPGPVTAEKPVRTSSRSIRAASACSSAVCPASVDRRSVVDPRSTAIWPTQP